MAEMVDIVSNLIGVYALIGIVVMLLPRNIKDCKLIWSDIKHYSGLAKVITWFTLIAICYIAWPITLYGVWGRK